MDWHFSINGLGRRNTVSPKRANRLPATPTAGSNSIIDILQREPKAKRSITPISRGSVTMT